jgi:hypothetical protein
MRNIDFVSPTCCIHIHLLSITDQPLSAIPPSYDQFSQSAPEIQILVLAIRQLIFRCILVAMLQLPTILPLRWQHQSHTQVLFLNQKLSLQPGCYTLYNCTTPPASASSTATCNIDPFAFMVIMPSLVKIPPSPQGDINSCDLLSCCSLSFSTSLPFAISVGNTIAYGSRRFHHFVHGTCAIASDTPSCMSISIVIIIWCPTFNSTIHIDTIC